MNGWSRTFAPPSYFSHHHSKYQVDAFSTIKMNEAQAWRQLSMELDCEPPQLDSQTLQPSSNIFHNEVTLSRNDIAYWTGRYTRTGPHFLRRDLDEVLHDVSFAQSPMPIIYDVEGTEGPFPATCISQSDFDVTLSEYRENKMSLTGPEVAKLYGGLIHQGKEYSGVIDAAFRKAVATYVTFAPGDAAPIPVSSYMRILGVSAAYNEFAHGSCLFRSIDFCLNGYYEYENSPNLSDQDKEDIVYAHVNDIKEQFTAFIKRNLERASTKTDKQNLMEQVLAGHEYPEQFQNAIDELCDVVFDHHSFMEYIGRLFSDFKPSNDYAAYVWQCFEQKSFILNVACDEALFIDWLGSDKPMRPATPAEIEKVTQNGREGVGGFIIPAGYMNKWSEGNEYELSLVPEVFRRQIVLLDHDLPLAKAGLGLKCSTSGVPAYLAPGLLHTMNSVSVYTSAATSAMSKNLGRSDAGPMFLLRSKGHYSVVTPSTDNDDLGKTLASCLRTASIYRYINVLHEEKRDFLTRIFKSLPIFRPEMLTNKTPLIPILKQHFTERQRRITVFLTYEELRFQAAFCNCMLQLPHHRSDYYDELSAHVAAFAQNCNFVSPGALIKGRTQY